MICLFLFSYIHTFQIWKRGGKGGGVLFGFQEGRLFSTLLVCTYIGAGG